MKKQPLKTVAPEVAELIRNLERNLLEEFSAGWETDHPDRKVIRACFREFWKPLLFGVDEAIEKHHAKDGSVDTRSLMNETGLTNPVVTRVLKAMGYTKPGGAKSHRWIAPEPDEWQAEDDEIDREENDDG